MTDNNKPKVFSSYQVFMIAVLALLQFTIILDFMVLSPLGALLLDELHLSTAQFGRVVSAYAFSAGVSGILAAGFADRFDRKKLLLFFYAGFVLGTALCAMATDYHFLLIARIVTGLFGGVIGSVSFAIITDIFAMQVRGRVMGFVQTAFAGSQILGLPVGLFLANQWGWHAPFWMIAGFALVLGIVIFARMKPVTAHLSGATQRINPFLHLFRTITNSRYAFAFATTTFIATGGFMMMPFSSAFTTNNLGISVHDFPIIYGVSGIFAMAFGPLLGKLSDKIGKYPVFLLGTIITAVMVLIYVHLGITPLWLLILVNVLMFAGISSRMISSSALMTAVPEMHDRGAFMSINASVQQIAGGIGAFVAGLIVVRAPSGRLEHFDTLGYVVICAMLVVLTMMYFLNKLVKQILATRPAPAAMPSPQGGQTAATPVPQAANIGE